MRLKSFDYADVDRGNQLYGIKDIHFEIEMIIITSAQISFLVSYLGIIIGDLIPPKDPVWDLYSVLFDIVNIVITIISRK